MNRNIIGRIVYVVTQTEINSLQRVLQKFMENTVNTR